MAELIIQNPSITPNVFEYDEAGRVSAISGYPLAGEGGGTVVKSDLMWKPTVGSDGYVHWSLASSATTPEAAYISGAQGPAGADGQDGTDGKDGKDGKDGYSISLQSVTDEDGGKKITLAWGETPETSSFVIPSGAKGADGKNGENGTPGTNGFSPTVATTPITAGDQTGTEITFTYGDEGAQTAKYSAWNGKDGTGATNYFDSTTISGDGTQADKYGLKTDAALYLPNTSAYSATYAEQYWDEDQGRFLSISGQIDQLYDSIDDKLEQSVWDANSGKFLQIVSATNGVSGNGTTGSPIGLEAGVTQQLSKIDSKTRLTSAAGHVLSAQDGTTADPASNFALSAVDYMRNLSTTAYAPQRLVVVTGDNDIINNHATYSEGVYGTLFFVTSAHA